MDENMVTPLRSPKANETQTFSVYFSYVESNFLENINIVSQPELR